MVSESIETRFLALESRYRRLQSLAIALAAICVGVCGAVGYLVGRVDAAAQAPGLRSEDGAVSLEVSRLSIKNAAGAERARIDPGGLVVYGDKDKREQLRLDFSGLRFFSASGESSHFDSSELSFVDEKAGLRCTLDGRRLACTDEKGEGLAATIGILAPSGGTLPRTPHLSLADLKGNTGIDLLVLPAPSVSIRNKTGKTVVDAP
jgi:hypothetical protein